MIARREGYVLPDGKRSAVLSEPSSSPETSRHTEKELRRTIQGVELLRSFSLSCEHNNQNAAEADPETLLLRASMGMEKVVGFACAGFEAKNLGTLQLAVNLQSPHYGRYNNTTPRLLRRVRRRLPHATRLHAACSISRGPGQFEHVRSPLVGTVWAECG